MAAVNFLYRSVKSNAELEVRFTLKLENGEFKTIVAKSGIKIFENDSFNRNPFDKLASYRNGRVNPFDCYESLLELNGKFFYDFAIKKQQLFPEFTDAYKRKGLEDIFSKVNEVQHKLNKLGLSIVSAHEKVDIAHLTKSWLENQIKIFHNPQKKEKVKVPDTLIDYIDYYLKVNDNIENGTAKKFRTIKSKILKRLNLFDYGHSIMINEIDDDFKIQYKEVFADYAESTVQYDLKNIRTVCYHAKKKGLTISTDLDSWTVKSVEKNIIYLSEEEIGRIKELKNLFEYLDNARDWLIISCYTGQRVSDFMRFEKSMIREEVNINKKLIRILEFEQVKTRKQMVIPLHDEVVEVLNKRNGDFPRPISDQRYNEYIKEVAREAGLVSPIKGRKFNSETLRAEAGVYPKFELVSSHIGRRSFCSNFFGKIPTRLIMSASGHKTEAMFLEYIGKTETEQAKQLADYF